MDPTLGIMRSTDEFITLPEKGRLTGGSSISIGYFEEVRTKKEWIGKCSTLDISNFDSECRELLALKIYTLFGVKTPAVCLSFQTIATVQNLATEFPDLDKPRLHIMSQFLEGFEIFGKDFIETYKKESTGGETYHTVLIGEKRFPLVGFGAVLAISNLLHDYDCVGNSGGNIGYILNPSGGFATVVKISAGKALPFLFPLSENLQHVPERHNILIGTTSSFSFEELSKADQNEFTKTVEMILKYPESEIEKLIKEIQLKCGLKKEVCETTLELLLARKTLLLNAFFPEVSRCLHQQLHEIEEDNADNIQTNWDGYQPKQDKVEEKLTLIKYQANLGATKFQVNVSKEILMNAHQIPQGRITTDDTKNFQLPDRNIYFVGRESELSVLEKFFFKDKTSNQFCIFGSGGMGKTHLASHFIHMAIEQKKYELIIWLHAYQMFLQIKIFLEKYHQIHLEKMNESDLIKEFYSRFTATKTCVVIDDADDESSIKPFLQRKKKNVDILITSRFQNWSVPRLSLNSFGREETSIYLQKRLNKSFPEKDVEMFINTLEGSPLGIAQATGYIQQNNLNLLDYCKLFKRECSNLLRKGDIERRTVSTSLTLALAELRQKNKQVEIVLSISAYLSSDHLDLDLLESCCQQIIGKDVVELLINYSIVYQYEKGLKIQRLSQAVMRLIHERSGLSKYIHQVFNWLLPKLDYDKTDLQDIRRVSLLLPHAIYFCHVKNHPLHQKTLCELYEKIAYHQQYSVHNPKIGLEFYKKSLKILESNFSNDHPSIASTLTSLGNAWGSLGDYEKKKDLLIRALEIKERYFGKDHPETSNTLTNLANAWGSLGDYEQKKDLLIRALAIDERHYGKDHSDTGITLINLGIAWGSLGDYEKQKDLLIRALEIMKKNFGNEHPSTGITLTYLGNAWGELGYHEKQKELLVCALEIDEKQFGKDHPETGITLTYLGNAWGSLGVHEKQKDLLIRALAIKEKHFGKDHSSTGITLTYLGNAWGDLGDYEKQKDLLIRALAIKEKHFGKDHPETGITLSSLGKVLHCVGDFQNAFSHQKKAHQIFLNFYGSENHYTKFASQELQKLEDYM